MKTAGYIGCRIYVYEGRTYESPAKEMIKSAFKPPNEKVTFFPLLKVGEEIEGKPFLTAIVSATSVFLEV